MDETSPRHDSQPGPFASDSRRSDTAAGRRRRRGGTPARQSYDHSPAALDPVFLHAKIPHRDRTRLGSHFALYSLSHQHSAHRIVIPFPLLFSSYSFGLAFDLSNRIVFPSLAFYALFFALDGIITAFAGGEAELR